MSEDDGWGASSCHIYDDGTISHRTHWHAQANGKRIEGRSILFRVGCWRARRAHRRLMGEGPPTPPS